VGGVIGILRFPRLVGPRWIWSYLVVGSVAWSGTGLPLNGAMAAEDGAPAAPRPLASGEQTFSTATRPGTADATAVRGGWTFNASGAADVTYTDNVYLTDTNRLSDLIVSPQAALSAQRTTARTIFNADVDIAYDYYTKNTRLNGARPSALLRGFAHVIEDTLTLDGRLATDVQQISNEERVPAIKRNLDSNQTQILNYGITPTLRGRFGNVAGEASYDYSAVNFLDPPVGNALVRAGDTRRHVGRARLGTDESTADSFVWRASGSYERAHVDNLLAPTQPERASAEARGEYRLSAPFALVARGGYDWIEEPTLRIQPDGAYALGGVIWRPSQRTLVRAEAGYRYHDFNAEGDIQYQASQAVTLSASYRRDIQTGQRILLDSLNGIGRDEFGNLIDPITGLPPDPNAVQFDLTNQAFKRDEFRVGIHGRFQRNFYSASGNYERRSADGLGGKAWSGSGTLGRDITPRLQGSVTAAYAKTTADAGVSFSVRDSKTTSASARVDYELSRTMRTSLRYVHMRRSTTLVRYRENAAIFSISKVF